MSQAVFGRMSGLYGLAGRSVEQLISWGDHLKVEQPSIDAQHEAIFKLAVEIGEVWHKHGPLDVLKALCDKLARILEGHFRYEEKQLEEVGYPNLAEHKAEHQMMLEELRVIRGRLDGMGNSTLRSAPGFVVNNFILGVTVGHIGQSDMDYCAYARKAAKDKQKVWPAGKCPFCGSTEVHTFESDMSKWAASCAGCNATGPSSSSDEEAKARWNKAHEGVAE